MPIFAFAGGVAPVAAYGQKTKIRFVDTWTPGDLWTLRFTATLTGDFTVGAGNISGLGPTVALKLRDRFYLGIGEAFCLSAINDVTGWEEQNAGAAKISYTSQYGPQDEVVALASIQGRLAVFGAKSIQIWQIDADPNNLALQQTLDSSGTIAKLSVKSIGDFDVIYLDNSGVRSLRGKETSLNAYVNDIGTAIDLLIRAALVGYDATQACAIVEPTTRQYWLFLNGNIYVLSHYPQSKITAWSIYKPTVEVANTTAGANYSGGGTATYTGLTIGGVYYWTKGANDTSLTNGATILTASGGFVATATTAAAVGTPSAAITGVLKRVDTAFTPKKFVVHNKQVYVLASDNKVYRYGGSDNNTFDHCRATVETPWLDLGDPTIRKQAFGLHGAFNGAWTLQAEMNPRQIAMINVVDRGSATSPDMEEDSTFDLGHYQFSANGTHVKLKAVSGIAATTAKLGKIAFQFKKANAT